MSEMNQEYIIENAKSCERCAEYVRYCPECGNVGEVASTFLDCCSDGNHAVYIPKLIADKLAEIEAENARQNAIITQQAEQLAAVKTMAQAVIDRWDTQLWKDAPATATIIYALRDTIAEQKEGNNG